MPNRFLVSICLILVLAGCAGPRIEYQLDQSEPAPKLMILKKIPYPVTLVLPVAGSSDVIGGKSLEGHYRVLAQAAERYLPGVLEKPSFVWGQIPAPAPEVILLIKPKIELRYTSKPIDGSIAEMYSYGIMIGVECLLVSSDGLDIWKKTAQRVKNGTLRSIGGGGRLMDEMPPVPVAYEIFREITEDLSLSHQAVNYNPQSQAQARPFFGISARPVNSDDRKTLGLPDINGLLVTEVKKDSLAEKLAIKVDDLLLGLNGLDIQSSEALKKILSEAPEISSARVYRNGSNVELIMPTEF